jgi:hypothetical protein
VSKHPTHNQLEAIWAALNAALAGEGFDGGDFDGMEPDWFEEARDWAFNELQKSNKRIERGTKQ